MLVTIFTDGVVSMHEHTVLTMEGALERSLEKLESSAAVAFGLLSTLAVGQTVMVVVRVEVDRTKGRTLRGS